MATKIEAGRWCTGCKERHPLMAFGRDVSRPDGLNPTCKEFKNRRARLNHVSRAVPGSRRGPAPIPERDGDRLQARRSVNHLVETGRLPSPNDVPCTDCGHVTGDGRRHEYDHFMGYASGNHLKVEPVCSKCHHNREDRRRGNNED